MVQVAGQWEPAGGYASPDCHGRDHEVPLREGGGNTITDTFNVIIVRYGPRENSVPVPPLPQQFRNNLTLSRPRHLLPYHQPT